MHSTRLAWGFGVAGALTLLLLFFLRRPTPEGAPRARPVEAPAAPPVELSRQEPGAALPTTVAFGAVLLGTLPSQEDPRRGAAFLRSVRSGVEMVAFTGDPILHDGRTFEDLAGWTLEEVHRESAVFVNGAARQVLQLGQTAASLAGRPAPAVTFVSGPSEYESRAFETRLIVSDEREWVWGMDPREMAWLAGNRKQAFRRDVELADDDSRGLRLRSVREGSIWAARGFQKDDLVQSVNGMPLREVADFDEILGRLAAKNAGDLTLKVLRAGRPMKIEFKRVTP